MMRLLKPICLTMLLAISATCTAQYNWTALPNKGLIKTLSYRIEDIYFTDTLTGFSVSYDGKLYKTTDGGINWQLKNDSSQNHRFRTVEFLDDGITGLV